MLVSRQKILFLIFAVGVVLTVGFLNKGDVAKVQAAVEPINGYAWSSNIGWIQFNHGKNDPVTYDNSTKNFSGYAWSSNIGWIYFGPVDVPSSNLFIADAPESPKQWAYVDPGGGNPKVVKGWAKAVAGGGVGSGGWDGWIKMSGGWTNGVSYEPGTGNFSGFAWGSDVVGWVDFNPDCPDPETACQVTTNPAPIPPPAGDYSLIADTYTITATTKGSIDPVISTKAIIKVSNEPSFNKDVMLTVKSITPNISSVNSYFSDSTLTETEYSTGSEFWVDISKTTPSGNYTIMINGDTSAPSVHREITITLNVNKLAPSWQER